VAPRGSWFGRDLYEHDVMAVCERSERLDDRGSSGTRHCPEVNCVGCIVESSSIQLKGVLPYAVHGAKRE
jgi:hypothetical protein